MSLKLPEDRNVPKRPLKYYPILDRIPFFFKHGPANRPSSTSTGVWYIRGVMIRRHTTSGVFFSDNRANTFTGQSTSRSFQSNTNWRQTIAKGNNATYPYTRVGFSVKPLIWTGTSYTNNFGNPETDDHEGSYLGAYLILDTDDTTLKDVALARLKNRLSGNIGNASLLPPLAESREIHGLIRDINAFGIDAVKAMLAIKKTKGKSVLKLVGKVWLFFNFGVKPLIADVAKAANAINDYKTRADHSTPVFGTASKIWLSSSTANYGSIGNGITFEISNQAKHQLSYRYKGAVSLKLRTDASYSVLDHLGLDFGQLPSALWELTAFSWVADYFTTVGPWLDDVFYTLPGTLKYLSLNRRYLNENKHYPKAIYSATTRCNVNFTVGESKYFSFSRTSLTTLPTRELRVRSFDEIGQYGLSKLLNLASVLAGRLSTPRLHS